MRYIEEHFETKKAVFFSEKIVLKKKNITIERFEIDKICYARPTFLNYLFAGVNQLFPGQFVICLKKPLREGKRRDMFCG